jgi:hypothetical protein
MPTKESSLLLKNRVTILLENLLDEFDISTTGNPVYVTDDGDEIEVGEGLARLLDELQDVLRDGEDDLPWED